MYFHTRLLLLFLLEPKPANQTKKLKNTNILFLSSREPTKQRTTKNENEQKYCRYTGTCNWSVPIWIFFSLLCNMKDEIEWFLKLVKNLKTVSFTPKCSCSLKENMSRSIHVKFECVPVHRSFGFYSSTMETDIVHFNFGTRYIRVIQYKLYDIILL